MGRFKLKVRIALAIMIITASAFTLSGCDLFRTPVVDVEIGRLYSTQWFNFTIHSADMVSEFGGHTAGHGHQLWVVRITQTGTFREPVPMFIDDWYMDDDSFRAEHLALVAFESHPEMMPEEFWLPRGTSETHTMLFEVPANTTNLTLNFLEVDDANRTGSQFTLNLQR
ncbi:MAG: hypothetical protein FWC76_03175 [Defluviitaleaceae bacterium]|nr:hypothetical protein [Defluviitaleaceae bacterium]